MKNLIALLFVVALGTTTYAQDFEKGGNYITIGYGVDATGLPGSKVYRKLGIGPVLLTYERGITDIIGIGRIGVGGGIGFSHYGYNDYNTSFLGGYYGNDYLTSVNRINIFVKAPYHFEFDIDGLDVYAGAGLGVRIDSEKYNYWNNGSLTEGKRTNVGADYYIFAGARWYFSDAFGVYVEVGEGISNVNAGVVFAL